MTCRRVGSSLYLKEEVVRVEPLEAHPGQRSAEEMAQVVVAEVEVGEGERAEVVC